MIRPPLKSRELWVCAAAAAPTAIESTEPRAIILLRLALPRPLVSSGFAAAGSGWVAIGHAPVRAN